MSVPSDVNKRLIKFISLLCIFRQSADWIGVTIETWPAIKHAARVQARDVPFHVYIFIS